MNILETQAFKNELEKHAVVGWIAPALKGVAKKGLKAATKAGRFAAGVPKDFGRKFVDAPGKATGEFGKKLLTRAVVGSAAYEGVTAAKKAKQSLRAARLGRGRYSY